MQSGGTGDIQNDFDIIEEIPEPFHIISENPYEERLNNHTISIRISNGSEGFFNMHNDSIYNNKELNESLSSNQSKKSKMQMRKSAKKLKTLDERISIVDVAKGKA